MASCLFFFKAVLGEGTRRFFSLKMHFEVAWGIVWAPFGDNKGELAQTILETR